jgi:hypothetical protein
LIGKGIAPPWGMITGKLKKARVAEIGALAALAVLVSLG